MPGIYFTWSDLAYMPLAIVVAYLLLIALSWIIRKTFKVPPAEFDIPERMVAFAAWLFSPRARSWLREHPGKEQLHKHHRK